MMGGGVLSLSLILNASIPHFSDRIVSFRTHHQSNVRGRYYCKKEIDSRTLRALVKL